MKDKIEQLLHLLYGIKENSSHAADLATRNNRYTSDEREENQASGARIQQEYNLLLEEFYKLYHDQIENEPQPEIKAIRKLLESTPVLKKDCNKFEYDYLSNCDSGKPISNILRRASPVPNLHRIITVEASFPGTGGSGITWQHENFSKSLSALFNFPVYVEVRYGYHNSVKFDLPWYVIPTLNQTLRQHGIDLGKLNTQTQRDHPFTSISTLPHFHSYLSSEPAIRADNTPSLSTETLKH